MTNAKPVHVKTEIRPKTRAFRLEELVWDLYRLYLVKNIDVCKQILE